MGRSAPCASRVSGSPPPRSRSTPCSDFFIAIFALLFVLLVARRAQTAPAARRLQRRGHGARLRAVRQAAEDAVAARPAGILDAAVESHLRQPAARLLGRAAAGRSLVYAFLGCLVGTLVGMLPGIGPLSGISILLPVTFGLDATKAVIMLAGIYYGSQYGGSTTSILMRIPGEAASVMTCIDGYAMARGAAPARRSASRRSARSSPARSRHRAHAGGAAARHLRAALRAARIHRAPRPRPDLPRLHVVDSLMRTLPMAARPDARHDRHRRHDGYFRFSFDLKELGDGIGIVPVAVGLFGLAEILSTPSRGVTGKVIAAEDCANCCRVAQEWRESAMPIARGSVLGFIIGIIPGSAHIISSFVSYALEKRISKTSRGVRQGRGRRRRGPESANNAAATGAFVPMLALGVPTGPVTAVLIGALMVHGVAAGPAAHHRAPPPLLGLRRHHVCRQPDAARSSTCRWSACS